MRKRLSVKYVNETLKIIGNYKLSRWEHPTGKGYWYSYCVMETLEDGTIRYITKDMTLSQCNDFAMGIIRRNRESRLKK